METLPNVSPKRRIVAPAATQRKQAYALQIGSAEYRYDGEGNRVMKVVGSDTIRYVMGLGEHSSATGPFPLRSWLP